MLWCNNKKSCKKRLWMGICLCSQRFCNVCILLSIFLYKDNNNALQKALQNILQLSCKKIAAMLAFCFCLWLFSAHILTKFANRFFDAMHVNRGEHLRSAKHINRKFPKRPLHIVFRRFVFVATKKAANAIKKLLPIRFI